MERKFEVDFKVKAETRSGETVCIVGDCAELGNWDPHLARALCLEKKTNDGMELWTCSVRLSAAQEIQYRYFIGHIQDAETDGESKLVMVRVWETNLRPRRFSVKNFFLLPEDHQNTESVFGFYDGRHSVDKGWLTGQTEIHFRLMNNPIRMWKKKHQEQTYSVKCTAIDLRYKDASSGFDGDEEESSHELLNAGHANEVLVSVLDGNANIPHEQPMFGSVYLEDSFITFRVQTFEPEFLGFKFELFGRHQSSTPGDIPQLVGSSIVLPVNLKQPVGVKTVPITGVKNLPIGQLTVDCLLIKPIRNELSDCRVSYSNHWKHKRRALDVGHRGMGSSHCDPAKKCAAVRENTIASLSEAGGHGADFVEFDVQLTKNNVPVIYHDFTVCLTLKKRDNTQHEYFEIPVQDLNLEQLQALKLNHPSEREQKPAGLHDAEEPDEHRPFPTLRQAFEALDPHVGFAIEIKYCAQMKSGELEGNLSHFMERNKYIDRLLEDMLKFAGNRRIVLLCFDPDICTMMRLKQNRYPVIMLCQGDTKSYPPYMDLRTWTLPLAYNFCQSEGLLGVGPFSERLLADSSLIHKAKELKLIIFTWGDDNNRVDNIKKLKNMGVEGVIYDRIYELKDNKENVFLMEHNAKVHLLREMGVLGNESSGGGSRVRLSSEAGSSSASSSGTFRHEHIADIGKQQSLPS